MISPGWFPLFLAMVVVLYHTTRFVFIGYWAVFVFFVLSGFWITEMYRGKYHKSNNALIAFYASRFIRLAPTFVACGIFAAIVIAAGFSSVPQDYAFSPSWLLRSFGLVGTSVMHPRLIETMWSRDIEVQFYLLFPLLYLALTQTHRVAITSVVICLATITWSVGIDNSLLAYLVFFLAGYTLSQSGWRAGPRLFWGSLVIGALIFSGLVFYPETRQSIQHSGKIIVNDGDLTRALDVLLMLVAIPFVSVNVRRHETKWGFHAGNLSYPVYLVHWVVLGSYIALTSGLGMRARLRYFFAYLVCSLIASLAVYVTFDRPVDRWRRQWVRHFTD